MCPMDLVSLRGLDRDRRCEPTGATGATAVTGATAADDTRRRGGVWKVWKTEERCYKRGVIT